MIKKWKLEKAEDISPSTWYPLEKRSYTLPSGEIVDDYYLSTLEDVAMIVPVTKEGEVILVKQYKPGANDQVIEFPAGRLEPKKHKNILETAVIELEEETGIMADPSDLHLVGTLFIAPSKATTKVSIFVLEKAVITTSQKLDPSEDIKVINLTPKQIDEMILDGRINVSDTIAAWTLTKNQGLI